MSSAKFIILGDMKQGTEALPTAVHFLKQARKDGNQGLNKTFYFGEIKIRVVLDPHAGDKVYIEPPDCGQIAFSGFLDTFKGVEALPPTPRYLIEDQLTKEYRVPRSELAPIPAAKLIYGVRPIKQGANLINGISGSGAPVNTIGVDGDLYIRTDSDQLYQKELDMWYEITQNSSEPQLTTHLPVEATISETLEDGTIRYTVATSLFKDTYEALLPTRFTGIMRRIMQVTFSTPSWRGFAPVGDRPAVSPVSYKFGDSWGCIKHNDGYFLVQITSAAVYSVPADLCVRQFKDATGAVRDAITLKSANVAKRVKIGEIPPGLGASWNQEIGWAFSYTIPEAAIVYETRKFVGAEEFMATRLLTLAFGFDANNSLTSAVLSVTGPYVFWVNEYTNARYPTGKGLFNIVADLGIAGGGIQNVSVDFGKQYPAQSIAGYEANDIPVYVFYTEKGQQLCTYSNHTEPGRTDVISQEVTEQVTSYLANASGTPDTAVDTDFEKIIVQPWFGSKSVSEYNSYGFSCAGSPQLRAEGAKNDAYTQWTWEWVYGETIGYVDSVGLYQMLYQAYDGGGNPIGDPYYVGPYASQVAYRGSKKVMRGRSEIVETTGGATVACSLTLSTIDRECVLIVSSKYRYSGTRTDTATTWGYYTVESSVGATPYGTNDVSAEAEVDYAVTDWVAYGLECYKLRGSLNKWRYTSSIPKTLYLGLAQSADPTAPWYTTIYTPGTGVVYGPGCWGASAAQYGTSTSTTYGVADVVTVTTTEPIGETFGLIYGHDDPVQLPSYNIGLVSQVHPEIAMVFWFSQAAHSPKNYVTHGSGINSAAVVKINNTTYDVKNQLFGWIGVA